MAPDNSASYRPNGGLLQKCYEQFGPTSRIPKAEKTCLQHCELLKMLRDQLSWRACNGVAPDNSTSYRPNGGPLQKCYEQLGPTSRIPKAEKTCLQHCELLKMLRDQLSWRACNSAACCSRFRLLNGERQTLRILCFSLRRP